jgi:hypothetical protein
MLTEERLIAREGPATGSCSWSQESPGPWCPRGCSALAHRGVAGWRPGQRRHRRGGGGWRRRDGDTGPRHKVLHGAGWVVLGWLRLGSDSLLAPVLAHWTANALGVIVALVPSWLVA